ncbi:PREDICTED: protein Gawky [Atta cephalotes]|uniref:UBA domain-containing protein n=1 Tax=Atta cephalotes TaxID=12957 RepID=A0A158NTB7_ATTCE|nr:PREDICTED: protein Gawky [Atta cephalotes]
MFPHNSSSHEISTETNAFVQNSMGDVVVLEESSLDGVGEGEGSEHIRYCDIESIANSSMMAAPISHPEATAANDFSTVLLNQAGEFNSTGIGKACQSVAPATTKYPTNHPQICDNNNKINNHNNAEHNHHKYRKQNTPGLLGLQLGSSANNSKSTCKTLSDNKTSFSTVYIRVHIRVSVNFERDEMCYTVGVPSLVRIPKSDSPQRLLRLPNSDDNYSLLGSCLDLGDNNKFKANFSYVSNNNSKSVILLSSTSYSNHYLLFSGGFDKIAAVIPVLCIKRVDSTTTSNRMKLLGDKYALVTSFAQISRLLANDRILDDSNSDIRVSLSRRIVRHLLESHLNVITLVLVSVHAQNFAMYAASSSITLIVSRNEVIDHTLRSFLKNLTQLYVQSSISPLCNVTVTELMQHICVPLLIICKSNYNVGNNYNEYYNEYSNVGSIEEEINISNNNPDVIGDIVDIAVCYKTSVMTTNVRILGSQNDGISCTEATIYTVGALLFQDNNKPLNICFKISRHRGLVTTDRESNSTIKSVFRSKLNDKCSNVKFETSHAARLDESDNSKQVKLTVNIPIMTTCKPTMTLTCQSATVASQTIVVPVSRAESRTNDNEMRLEYFNILQNDQICIQYMLLSHTDDLNKNDLCRYDATKFKDAQIYAIDKLKAITTSKDDAQLISKYHRDTLKYDQSRKNDDDNAIICNGNEDFSLSTTIWHFLKQYVRALVSDCRRIYETNRNEYEVNRRRLRSILDILIRKSYVSELYENYNEPIASYKQRWGIPIGLRLVGGGESSLNSGGAANWGTTQATTPNNNNTNQSGWGGTPGNPPGSANAPNNWGGNTVNRSVTGNPNQNQNQGPPGNQNNPGSNWGDPRIDHRDPRDLRSVDPREMRDPRDHRMSLDPRDHMRVMDPMARDPRMADMRGDPRGISGRLHGANADAMWSQPPGPPHHQMGHQHPSGPPAKMLNPSNMNQWAAQPPKDIMPGKPSGWEEPSPPTQRRNVPNYDDGTSLWGNPAANQRAMPGSKVSHWKDIPAPNLARGGMQCPPGMPQNRMPGQPGMKPDVSNPMWGHPGAPGGRNGTWTDGPHDTASWDDPKTPATWNEPPLNPGWGGPTAHKPKPMGPAGSWTDSDMDPTPSWAHPAKPTLTKEVIWNSREFRYLCDLGFKKEDVEVALRNREMNREEALELLNQIRPVDQWRRHETHSGYDPTHQATTTPAYPRFNHVGQQMSFPPGGGVPSGATSGGVGGSVTSASLLKLQQQQQQQTAVPLQQQQPSTNTPQPPFNQASRASQNQPSTQQLRMLVQQIQLAVHEGYLNHQILNQPLAPQTLMLLNQLLQQIKVLQQLHQQHAVQNTMKGSNQSALQISVQITKTKQQITNLQNQIAVQQATYMKQQQQHPAPPSQASEYYKSSVHDPMTALQNSFSDISMNKEPPVSQQQSRLNQWKLPSLDKDGDLVSNEFSRAPGTTSKPPATPGGLTQSHSSPNMNPLLGQGDGTWSSRLGDSGWPDPSNSDSTDGKDWQPGGAAYTDLVPEFEPGKPWKGTQIKSIEDDPSITPGSVVRSPLSLATIKDTDTIFSSSSKTSPPPQAANPDTSIPSLSNSTWTFNPPVTTPSAFTSTSKNTWGESAPPPTAVTSELWGAPMSKARGPPPGLSSKGATNASNGWGAGLGSVSRSSSSWGLQSSTVSNSGWMSTWLLLKNLTPQIDGSTLKTLCMQHGPVQDFRLYQNHGIALTKYSSRDEAIKAQGALNNCVLGNTTIFAESPAESEVAAILQQLGHGGQQQAGGSGGAGWGLRPTNKAGPPPDTWGGSSSQLWGAPPTSNSLWSNAGIDNSDQQRATPSSLNSYLPGDLLGGESM